jgi:hypothetical protein
MNLAAPRRVRFFRAPSKFPAWQNHIAPITANSDGASSYIGLFDDGDGILKRFLRPLGHQSRRTRNPLRPQSASSPSPAHYIFVNFY